MSRGWAIGRLLPGSSLFRRRPRQSWAGRGSIVTLVSDSGGPRHPLAGQDGWRLAASDRGPIATLLPHVFLNLFFRYSCDVFVGTRARVLAYLSRCLSCFAFSRLLRGDVYGCEHTHTHTHTRTFVHAHTGTHARARACTHARTHARAHTHKDEPPCPSSLPSSCVRVCARAGSQERVCVCVCVLARLAPAAYPPTPARDRVSACQPTVRAGRGGLLQVLDLEDLGSSKYPLFHYIRMISGAKHRADKGPGSGTPGRYATTPLPGPARGEGGSIRGAVGRLIGDPGRRPGWGRPLRAVTVLGHRDRPRGFPQSGSGRNPPPPPAAAPLRPRSLRLAGKLPRWPRRPLRRPASRLTLMLPGHVCVSLGTRKARRRRHRGAVA